jgi:hypothetical protein
MSAATQLQKQETWIPTSKAMDLTGLSRSALIRAAQKHNFHKQNIREGSSDVTHYLESDLLAHLNGAPASATALQRTGNGQMPQAAVEFWNALAERITPQKPKLFVTVDEAVKISGLPRRWLRAKVKDGSLGKDYGIEGGKRRYLIGMGELEALSRGEM